MSLYMVQMHPDPAALIRFLASQGLNQNADTDLGYGVHAWLSAVFGERVPHPFRLYMDAHPYQPPKLLAYSSHKLEELLDHALSFAEPAARAVCQLEQDLSVAKLPGPAQWATGRRLGFEVLACPVVRRARSGVERDVFLHHADHAAPDAGLSRAVIYGDWLSTQCRDAIAIETVELAGFHLVRQWRRGQRTGKEKREHSRLTRPSALLRGVLRITDGADFHALLARGIGRHRTFGYGMLLLKPV